MKRLISLAALACLVLLLGQQSIGAGDQRKTTKERLTELEEAVTALQQRVDTLEQRVQQLETKAGEEPEAQTGPPKYTLQANWDQLQKGLSRDQVRSILGEPGQKSQDGRSWFYMVRHKLYPVTFDESGAVTEWKSPFK
jgi:uncharacterized coiled-coil protein SlyX